MEDEITPAEEEKETDVVTEEPLEESLIEEPKEKTVGELLNGEKSQTVPLKTFLDTKKDLKREIADLKSQIAGGATKKEINTDLNAIADKYDVDPKFLSELSDVIYAKAKGEADQVLNEKLKPLEEKDRAEKIEKAFNEHFEKVMEEIPEYSNVVNKNVIKELSLLPQNANRTFQQIIEETYGKTVTGKKTMETSIPRGGKDTGLDSKRLNDPEYFSKVMANPELKKKYNESIQNRIQL